jgi:hypothetical protein
MMSDWRRRALPQYVVPRPVGVRLRYRLLVARRCALLSAMPAVRVWRGAV